MYFRAYSKYNSCRLNDGFVSYAELLRDSTVAKLILKKMGTNSFLQAPLRALLCHVMKKSAKNYKELQNQGISNRKTSSTDLNRDSTKKQGQGTWSSITQQKRKYQLVVLK